MSVACWISILVVMMVSCKSHKIMQDAVSSDEKKQLYTYLFVDGVSARLRNDYEPSFQKFEQCIHLLPQEPAAYYEMGMVLHLSGQPLRALPYAEKAFELSSRNLWYGLFYADLLSMTGNQTMSLKVKERLYKEFPNHAEICFRLAEEYIKAGMSEVALQWLTRAELIVGTSEEISLEKISLFQEKKKFQEIEKEFQKLIDSNPSEVRYLNYLAEFYLHQQLPDKAMPVFDKIFSMDPDHPSALINLATYFIQRLDFQRGMDYVNRLIESGRVDISEKSRMLSMLELSYLENKNNLALEAELKKTIFLLYSISPNHFESNYWMSRYYKIYGNQPDSAHFYLSRCLRFDKSRPELFRVVIEYNLEKQNYDSCYVQAAQAVELYPNEPQFFLAKGISAYFLNRYNESIQDLNYAKELPGVQKKEMITALFYLAKAWHHLKNYENSDRAHETLLKLDADYAPALNNYAWMLAERKVFLERAEKMARHAFDLYPDRAQYADTYGYVLLLQKKYSEALEKFKLAHTIMPDKTIYMEHAGDACYLNGDLNQAIDWWNKALKKGGDAQKLNKKIMFGITNADI